jgi:hypothetical protein
MSPMSPLSVNSARQLGDIRRNPPRLARMYSGRGSIWLFVSYLALNLLGELWRNRLHTVFLSSVLRLGRMHAGRGQFPFD